MTIISDDSAQFAQYALQSHILRKYYEHRQAENDAMPEDVPTKTSVYGASLLSGLLYCAHCGCRLVGTYCTKQRKTGAQLKLAKAELEKLRQQDARLRQEAMRSLMGESAFDADRLKEMLERNKADIAEVRLEALEAEKDAEASHRKYLSAQYQLIRDWAAEFDNADNDTKKMILARLIEKITVDRHYHPNITFYVEEDAFHECIAAEEPP